MGLDKHFAPLGLVLLEYLFFYKQKVPMGLKQLR